MVISERGRRVVRVRTAALVDRILASTEGGLSQGIFLRLGAERLFIGGRAQRTASEAQCLHSMLVKSAWGDFRISITVISASWSTRWRSTIAEWILKLFAFDCIGSIPVFDATGKNLFASVHHLALALVQRFIGNDTLRDVLVSPRQPLLEREKERGREGWLGIPCELRLGHRQNCIDRLGQADACRLSFVSVEFAQISILHGMLRT